MGRVDEFWRHAKADAVGGGEGSRQRPPLANRCVVSGGWTHAEVITALVGAPRSEGRRAGWGRTNDNKMKHDAVLVCDVHTAQLDVWQGHDARSRSRRRRRRRVKGAVALSAVAAGWKRRPPGCRRVFVGWEMRSKSVAVAMREISQRMAIRRRRRRL
jgi:hypothetical protein